MSLSSKLGSNILLRSPNWLGDAVMTLPAVQTLLAQTQPNTRISVLTPAKLADFWQLVPGLQSTLIVDDNIVITADSLKSHAFDSAILFPNSLRSALEPWLAGIPQRYGYSGHHRRWLLTKTFQKPSRTQGYRHQKHDYLDLVQGLQKSEVRSQELEFIPLSNTGQNPFKNPYLIICPGAEYGASKRWPVERYAALADELISRHKLHLIILGSVTDIPAAQALTKNLSLPTSSYTDLTGQTSLREFLNFIAHASLVVCNDSGSMHVAAALGTKALSLFGSTEPKLTGPIHDSVTVIRHHVPCSPCFLRDCPIDFRCMNAISVKEVALKSEALL